MRMTETDDALIARALKKVLTDYYGKKNCELTDTPKEVLRNVADQLSRELRATQPQFDALKFYQACGLQP